MARRKSLKTWVDENQGKHRCHCGCNQVIVINRNHASNGIPDYIPGHGRRRKSVKYGYLRPKDRKVWVDENQGKHRCHCGCNQIIDITVHHYTNGIPKYIHGHNSSLFYRSNWESRFWNRVIKTNGCWEWKGARTKNGYGVFGLGNKHIRAHRFSYKMHFGDFDKNLDVLHRCDNPKCVNPKHLFLGTQADNNKDAAVKGRLNSILKSKDVIKIVKLVRSGMKKSMIAKKFGIKPPTLSCILSGKSWSHVTGICWSKTDGE